ncbi:MAG: DUF1992 domain-containing protein [Acidobacteria bacterium]|nr:DUF1992 domain-containing protein [Acidobacteriota bacterium]
MVQWGINNDSIDIFQLIAERKIVEAIDRGEFDNLPGKGKPLSLSQDPLESPDQRLANKILNNAGVAPVEVSLRRELDQLKREYARARNAKERQALMREIRLMILRINVMRRAPAQAEAVEAIVDAELSIED